MPAAVLAVFGYLQFSASRAQSKPNIGYSDLFHLVDQGKVQTATIKGQLVTGKINGSEQVDGKSLTAFSARLPPQDDREFIPLLRQKGVKIDVESEEQPFYLQVLLAIAPWILILAAWGWISRRTQGMLSKGPLAGMMQGRSRRYAREDQVGVTFDDVAGLQAAKRDLREIADFLKEPERFRGLGGKVPRGVLLVGPPGTGKTLLARAVAGEARVPFFSISGAEFIELFVGMGASRVRTLFEEAKKVAPCIVFIDEVDAVGRSRGTGLGGSSDEREQTLNQLLSEMDGFARNDLTVVIAATNRPDVLDSALLRPGRFDRQILVDRPERAARRSILEVHTRDKPLDGDAKLDSIADNTPGFSGADLANLVNEAALSATRRGASAIQARDFSAAYDRIVLGDVRETKLDANEKRRVAVHESGHATLAHYTAHAEPLERVSIIPRGMALGVTQQSPGADKHLLTRHELEARLSVLMGGYAAEEVVLGTCSSGAENDLKRATELAFKMAAHFGMSERIGPVYYAHRTEHPFLGQSVTTDGGTSDATVHVIEQEARGFLVKALEQAKATIAKRRTALDALVDALLVQETLEKLDLQRLLGPVASLEETGEG
ncbi:MAG TPA: ATP-dependent zinc metalloprotease FtsH [Polyangiaceae bacterium]|nr:ATP-dependent zinc metalloprotease FtsH [Polyangiaceae bacterium]